MKFYYNGQLIRTSKNHIYTHAIIDITDNGCVGCRADKESAEAFIRSEISTTQRSIQNCENAIKALKNGKDGYFVKEGRRTYYDKFDSRDTVERYENRINWLNGYIEKINTTWKVVELEAR